MEIKASNPKSQKKKWTSSWNSRPVEETEKVLELTVAVCVVKIVFEVSTSEVLNSVPV